MARAKWTGTIRLDRQALAIPTHWRKQQMIFVNSMSDPVGPCMDAPVDARGPFERCWQAMIGCCHVFGLEVRP